MDPKLTRDQLEADCLAGLYVNELVRKYNTSKYFIKKYLKLYNITLPEADMSSVIKQAYINNPEYLDNKSKIAKSLWESEEYRNKVVDTQKLVWSDPKKRMEQSELIKKKYGEINSIRQSELSKQWWENPEYRSKVVTGMSERSKLNWASEEYRSKVVDGVINTLNTFKFRNARIARTALNRIGRTYVSHESPPMAEGLKDLLKNSKQLKTDAFNAYGGCRCVDCGITELSVLTLDHKFNDGASDRKLIGGSGVILYKYLKDNSYPNKDRYQVLCMNCNWKKVCDLKVGTQTHRSQRSFQKNYGLKIDTFNAYGGCRCTLCGIIDLGLLTLDHVNGGGRRERKKLHIKGGVGFYQYLKDGGFLRKDEFRVLCRNCQLKTSIR